MGGEDRKIEEIKTVEVVSLDENVSIPSCLQKMEDITFSAMNAAGAVLGIELIYGVIFFCLYFSTFVLNRIWRT